MNIYSLPNFAVSLLLFMLGLFVYSKNRKSEINILFSLFAFSVFLWQFAYGLLYSTTSDSSARIYVKIGYVSVILMGVLFYHFVITFLRKNNERKIVLLSYIISSIFIYMLCRTNLFIDEFFNYFWGLYPKASILHPLFLVFISIICLRYIMLLFLYFRKQRNAISSPDYNRIKYMLLAAGVGTLVVIDFIPNYGIEIFPLGFVFMTFFVSAIAYAIVRHQLMDIEVIIKKTLVFAGLFAAIYGVFAGFTFLGQVIFEHLTGGNRWMSLIPSIVIIVLILRPLENFLIKTTDKYLFQKKYDYKELLKTFTTEVLTVLDINKLVRLTVEKMSNIIKIESCGILLLNSARDRYELVASAGIGKIKNAFGMDNTLVTFLDRTRLCLSVKDQGEDSQLPEKITFDMNKLKLELAIPLTIHDRMIGILTLGKKKSDEAYTQDDMDILLPLARTLSIAINNAEMFDELGKTQAEAAQREKMAVIGTLAAGINHEICNPLGIARGQCEVFLLNSKEGLYKERSKDEQIYEAMQIMEKVIKETDRATAITKKLSGFAKPGMGNVNEDVNISHEVDEVMALVGHELTLENIKVVKDIPKDLPHILADRKQMQEILFNLVRNAGQAIEENGRIVIKAKEKNGKLIIEIADNGHGIPEDKLEQIFNPFYTTKAPGKGTGLGLFIVRQVIQKNKGTIFVKSKVGEGTTFSLEFPVPQMVTK